MIITDKGEIKKLRKPGKVEMSDCRVGVWVLKDEKPYKLTGRDIDACHFTWMNGIELSEDILDKCPNLDKWVSSSSSAQGYRFTAASYSYILWKCTIDGYYNIAMLNSTGSFMPIVKEWRYLHQIQNLFYTVTGTELKINL